MRKTFHFFGFEIIESYENGSFIVSLVSPIDGELYPINWHTSGSFERCCHEFAWLTLDGGETFRDALHEAIGRDRRIRESGCYVICGNETYYVVA